MVYIEDCCAEPSKHQNKAFIIQVISPYLEKIERIYQSTNDTSFFQDLESEPEKTLNFIKTEIRGLLIDHQNDIKNYKELFDWCNVEIAKGENEPIEIDHLNEKVPDISIIIGVSNVGRTPGLLKQTGNLIFKKTLIPINIVASSNFYSMIESNQTKAFLFQVDSPNCSFQEEKNFYENLIIKNQNTVRIELELADNTLIRKRGLRLFDDTKLSI